MNATWLKLGRDKLWQLLVTLSVLLLVWQLVVTLLAMPSYIFPSPVSVGQALVEQASILTHHASITLLEIGLGLLLGVWFGIIFALILLMNERLNRWLLPVIIISQAIPVFALAPILMLWFGFGIASKVVMASIIIFFPITTCCYDGLKHTPNGYLDLALSLKLTRWQILTRVKLPAALPALASGLRVAVVIAPIGAVIGEWVGASAGLGYYLLQSNARMQVDNMFAALVVLSLISMVLYFSVDKLLTHFIHWTAY